MKIQLFIFIYLIIGLTLYGQDTGLHGWKQFEQLTPKSGFYLCNHPDSCSKDVGIYDLLHVNRFQLKASPFVALNGIDSVFIKSGKGLTRDILVVFSKRKSVELGMFETNWVGRWIALLLDGRVVTVFSPMSKNDGTSAKITADWYVEGDENFEEEIMTRLMAAQYR